MNVLAAIRETVEYANACPDVPDGGPTGSGHMEDMLRRIEAADPPFSYGKLCRWLGWMQGCIVAAMDREDQTAGLETMKAINKRHSDYAATPTAPDATLSSGGGEMDLPPAEPNRIERFSAKLKRVDHRSPAPAPDGEA